MITLMHCSYASMSQDTLYFIGNAAVIGVGINQGDYKTWPYKGADWSLVPEQKNIIAEYQVNAGKLLRPLSNSYSVFFESGFKVGYQAGKISDGVERATYSETYIGVPVALGLLKMNKQRVQKHAIGFALYGSVVKEVRNESMNDKSWRFFSQPRGTVFVNTHLLFPSKKSGRYRGVGVEVSKDIGFNYKAPTIPFAVENMRLGITFHPFCDFF